MFRYSRGLAINMAGFFYNLGKKAGPKIRKGKWVWQNLTGTEEDIITAEYKVGTDLVAELKSQITVSPDPDKRKLVQDTGRKLSAWVSNKYRKFCFEIIQQDKANAFALPGGFIFITESLLDLCDGDVDALAFVLAHEMAHVIRGHAIDRLITSSAINVASRTAATSGAVGIWLKRVGINFLESAYSRDSETEADLLGARLTKAAGYDTQGPIRLFEKLMNSNDQKQLSVLSEYFSTHPQLAVRIRNIKNSD